MTILYFILVLGVTVLIHELGHFIFAKKAGVYIYEFSIGMGPQIFKFKRKNDETIYSIRLLPIGGFVSMAGEDLEIDTKIPKDKQLCNKSWCDRFLVLFAGIAFNFMLAIIILFTIGLINGVPKNNLEIAYIDNNYSISDTNIQIGDVITKINNKKITSYEQLSVELAINDGKKINLTVKNENGEETYVIEPTLVESDGASYVYGFSLSNEKEKGVFKSIEYAFQKTGNLTNQMVLIVKYLVTGKLSLNNLSGPVGIYQIVDQAKTLGFLNVLYLIAYLCINVGCINFIPFPAFDGGRILFLIIEKIKGSKVNPKVENTIHSIGFVLLMLLMVFVTYNDIIRIFG
jgi:regulator of sigma E protease